MNKASDIFNTQYRKMYFPYKYGCISRSSTGAYRRNHIAIFLILAGTFKLAGSPAVMRRRELTYLAPTSARRGKTPQRREGLTPTLSKREGEPARWARRLEALARRRDGR